MLNKCMNLRGGKGSETGLNSVSCPIKIYQNDSKWGSSAQAQKPWRSWTIHRPPAETPGAFFFTMFIQVESDSPRRNKSEKARRMSEYMDLGSPSIWTIWISCAMHLKLACSSLWKASSSSEKMILLPGELAHRHLVISGQHSEISGLSGHKNQEPQKSSKQIISGWMIPQIISYQDDIGLH